MILPLLALLACSDSPPCDNPTTFLLDRDQDGYAGEDTLTSCTEPEGWSAVRGDCDDDDPTAYPGAPEVWYDGIDQDCAGDADGDADGDGYDGIAGGGLDCDDQDPDVNPGAEEQCGNGVDDDCDGDPEDCTLPSVITTDMADKRYLGIEDRQYLGADVAMAADLDMDGWPEVVWTAPYRTSPDDDDEYQSMVEYAQTDGTQWTRTTMVAETKPQSLALIQLHADFDYDGDHWPDVAVTAYGSMDAGVASPNRVYVFLSPPVGNLSTAQADLTLIGPSSTNNSFGVATAAAGTTEDPSSVALSAEFQVVHGATAAGSVYIVSARSTGEVQVTDDDERLYCDVKDCRFATDIASADFDGDGILDLAVGSARYLVQGSVGAADGHLDEEEFSSLTTYLGPFDSTRRIDDYDGARFASSINGLGGELQVGPDIDGDGVVDLGAGAPMGDQGGASETRVMVYSGAEMTLVSGDLDNTIMRIDASTDGFEEDGADVEFGDVDGDGNADLLMSASAVAAPERGWSALLFHGPLSGVYLNDEADVAWPVPTSFGLYSYPVATGFDLNADGCDDVAIGAADYTDDGKDTRRGGVFITYGGCL